MKTVLLPRSAALLGAVFSALSAASCAPSGGAAERAPGAPPRVVATVFPAWDWVRAVMGDRANGAEPVLLAHGGADLHGFGPTVRDMAAIRDCDLFVHVGGESDGWVPGALASVPAPGRRTLSLVEALGDRAVPDAGGEPDEHVWLSLRNADRLVGRLAEALAEADPAGAAVYRANAEAYRAKLRSLDAEYAAAVEAGAHRELVFADRFPFRYLANDYGLRCEAAFDGCSAETEAGFRTVARLADRVREAGLPAVLTLENPRHRIAETVAEAAGRPGLAILRLDSMQGAADGGATYLGTMERNLATLREALR